MSNYDVVETYENSDVTCKVVVDDEYRPISDHLFSPMAVISFERYGRSSVLYDAMDECPSADTIRALDQGKRADILAGLCAENNFELVKTAKRFGVQNECYPDEFRRFYKSEESRYFGILKHLGLWDLRVKLMRTNDSSRIYCVWREAEFTAYAGNVCDDADCSIVQSILDGEVYGYILSTLDDDHAESCWGFIGDYKYCLEVGQEVCDDLAMKRAELNKLEKEMAATSFARSLETSRPDLYSTINLSVRTQL
jgi:hypothetical protein